MIFAVLDDNNVPKGFYRDDVHGSRNRPIYGNTPEPTSDDPYPVAPVIGEETNPDCRIPVEAIEITEAQWRECLENSGRRQFIKNDDGEYQLVEHTPPEPEPDATVLPAVTLWERMTDDEAEQVNAAMATQPFRTRQIFLTANTFRSDHELWPLLVQMATELFGEERAGDLLFS
ncbi:hypothetical protein [Brucella haematophila]|uniref:hypothetical protein n=1 Tax=Brucella haematophila TaxID=419474 RepID=UPI001F394977|nr:hypothetical protein [Brucella haematophila]